MLLYLFALNLFVAAWNHRVTMAEVSGTLIDYRCSVLLKPEHIKSCSAEHREEHWIYNFDNDTCFSFYYCDGNTKLPDFSSEETCLQTCKGHKERLLAHPAK
uniref:Putative secreted protein n=1 Tax=Amblyomma parvum TaxID=251391 RepID=A0A023G274_AMBPA